MENKSYKSAYLIVVLTVLCVVMAIIAFHFSMQSKEYKNQYHSTNEKLNTTETNFKELSGKYKELSRLNGLGTQELLAKDSITKAFNIIFNYTNKNYVSRFDKAKKYMTDSVITKLKGSGGVLQSPKVEVKRVVNKIEVYRQIEKGHNIVSLVQLESTYSVNGEKNPSFHELYRVNVNVDSNKIDSLQLLGTINVFNHS